jgi:ubiquinone/menaquinone biosynthesis C-methylase UbiE
MKLNWAERLAVNNPLRVLQQRWEISRLKRMMPSTPGLRALEIGCGRGVGAGLILKEFQPAYVHAMDVDIRMVHKAKDYLASQEARVSLLVGDATSLPVRKGSVDVVFGFGVLHHVADWRTALGEIARVLEPGGAYFMEELYPAVYRNFITKRILLHPAADRFSSEDLKQALVQVGLPIKDAIELKKLWILGCAVKEG